MKTLRIRSQLTAADPLQAERLLKALRIILEHQEAPNASSLLGPNPTLLSLGAIRRKNKQMKELSYNLFHP